MYDHVTYVHIIVKLFLFNITIYANITICVHVCHNITCIKNIEHLNFEIKNPIGLGGGR